MRHEMTRLTITFDDETADSLDRLPVEELRDLLRTRLESTSITADQAPALTRLARSLTELGRDPSASAVVRQALDFFLAAIRDAEREARLEAGYALLATDEERDQMIEATSKRSLDRVADEP